MAGRIDLRKTSEGVHEMHFGNTEFERTERPLRWKVEFWAEEYENIDLEEREWPPLKADGKYVLAGATYKYPFDRFKVEDILWVQVSAEPQTPKDLETFDLYYVDATVEPPRETILAKDVDFAQWGDVPFWERPMVRNSAIGLGVVGAGLVVTKALEWW